VIRPLDGALREPLVLDLTCPIPEVEVRRVRKTAIRLLAIGEASYTCDGQLDPLMPPVIWTRDDVHPDVIAELHDWAQKKERRIEEQADRVIRAIAARVTIVRVENYSKHRELRLTPPEGAPFAPSGLLRPGDAIREAERLRRFLVGMALPTVGAWHVDRVMAAMANEDLAEHADPPL